MTIEFVHDVILFLLDQERNGKHTPGEIDKMLHLAQIDYFNELRPQRDARAFVYAQSTYIHEALNPFRTVKPFTNTDTPDGVLNIPDSEHLIAVTNQTTQGTKPFYAPVPLVNDDEFGYRMGSQIVTPTEARPIIHFSSNKIVQFYPKTPKAGQVFYLRTPPEPKFGYKETGREIAFSEGKSVDLLWNETYVPQVIKRALQYLGVVLDAQGVFQAMQLKQAETR